ncbi:sensor histidine kinase [Streptomyces sp. NPDC056161]|uniref:sensor histidine kinase n=1 Tax=Streptomyces sp. NPDC056161 TaxID=3345732 RepID=UPI0035D7885E
MTFGRAAASASWWAGTRHLLRRLGWLVWMAGLCAALVLDHLGALLGDQGLKLVKLCFALVAVAAVVVSPLLSARVLPAVAGLVGAASLAFSLAMRVCASPDWVAQYAYGFTEPVALMWLMMLVPLRGQRGRMTWTAPPVLWTAIVLRPVSIGFGSVQMAIILALFLAVCSTAILGASVAWRLVMVDRRRRASTLRLEQRTEFARDLHDFVAHHVTGIVVQAQGALAIADRRPELVRPALERIEQAGAEAVTSMRHMVGMLRDADGQPALAPLAGIAEVHALVEGFAGVGGAQARLDTEGAFDDLPVEVTTTAHRVVMEALTNVRRHAHRCTRVTVHMSRSADAVTVRVTDDGRPRQTGGGGFGLRGLAERVGLIGGRVEAGPVTGGGWGVEATLPAAPAGAGR